jgi:tetratricopeptide (TPR) repeat protein
MQELSLFENLRRRGVLETAIAYFVVGWLLIQIGDVVFDRLLLPWVGTFVTLLVIAGFPIAILLSWFLEFRHGRAVPHELTPKELLDRRFSRTYVSVISALAAAGVLVFIYDRTIGLPQAEDAAPQGILEQMTLPPIQQNSIAVLPFLNIDGSEQTEIFANGLADDLINSLARIPGMLVSARGDSFTLEPNSASERVRKRLRVALYLEGSVQIESTIMRVIVQLIDSKTGFHIYSRTFDRPLSGYFEMRDEIAELTVSNVRVALPHESQLLPSALNEVSDINAYVLFRRGKEIYEQPHTIESLSNVIDYYDEALAIDPEYAAAHAGKCAAFVELYNISKESLDIDHAEAACTAALTTSPRLGVVYTALGMLYRKTNRNSEAEKAFGDALALNGQDVQAMIGLSRVYQRSQRNDEAEALMKKAVSIQPGNWRAITGLGAYYFNIGRYLDAATAFRQVVLLAPENFHAYTNLGGALTMAGEFEAGRAVFQESLSIRETPTAYSNLGVAYYFLGDYENAVTSLSSAVDLSPADAVKWLNLADALNFVGRSEEARSAFERSKVLADSSLSVDPNDVGALYAFAWASQMLGDAEGASKALARSMEISPNDAYGYYYKALIDAESGRYDSALIAAGLAIEYGYSPKMLAAEPYLAVLKDDAAFRNLVVD